MNTSNWKQLGHTRGVLAIAISPNGRILASASFDHTARLWNIDNGQPISSPLHHPNFVNCVSFSSDGKTLTTACWDHNAYTWDVTAILKEAGLEDLLDQRDKSVLAAGATQRPVRQPIKVPLGFFDNSAHLSTQRRLHPLSSSSNESTLRSRLLSLPRPINLISRVTPPFHWVRNRLSASQSGADIELHERPSAVVDVPHCQAKRRDASARERRRPIPRPIRKNPTARSSRPPNSTITQQSSGAAQTQSSLQPHAAVSTSTTPPIVANTTNPHATIKHAGPWTRFWLFVCCASPEYTDGHH